MDDKYPISQDPLDEMVTALVKIEDKEVFRDFLVCLLTETELEEISKRWALVRLLDLGWSQRRIAQELHLSLCKITRGSRELKKPGSAFRKIIEIGRASCRERV